MTEFAKMDIFFFVTTVVVILLAVVVGLILYRIWRILGHVERISQLASEEAALVRGDVAKLREHISQSGLQFLMFKKTFLAMIKKYFGKKRGE
jgi:hypothetical protein